MGGGCCGRWSLMAPGPGSRRPSNGPTPALPHTGSHPGVEHGSSGHARGRERPSPTCAVDRDPEGRPPGSSVLCEHRMQATLKHHQQQARVLQSGIDQQRCHSCANCGPQQRIWSKQGRVVHGARLAHANRGWRQQPRPVTWSDISSFCGASFASYDAGGRVCDRPLQQAFHRASVLIHRQLSTCCVGVALGTPLPWRATSQAGVESHPPGTRSAAH